ncbi:unnamed protein product [Parajaminaea phylloscopi]
MTSFQVTHATASSLPVLLPHHFPRFRIIIAQIETGFNAADSDDVGTGDSIFRLGRVQYAFPAPLACLTVASSILTMCLYAYPQGAVLPQNLPAPPRLIRINLEEPEKTEEAEVPVSPPARNRSALPLDASAVGPHKMFSDPTGKHLVLSLRSGESFYWTSGWKKARVLTKWRGVVVESIAWNPNSKPSNRKEGPSPGRNLTTKEILVGSASGDIYEAVISTSTAAEDEGDFLDRLARRTAGGGPSGGDLDRGFRHLFSLSEKQAISGLATFPFAPQGVDAPFRQRSAIIATTSTRIYEFVGSLGKDKSNDSEAQSLYGKVFEPYKGSVPNLKAELPGHIPHSELRVLTSHDQRSAKALVWLSGPGIYHAFLSFANQGVGDSVIDSANLLPYPATILEDSDTARNTVAEVPLGIALTDFHFVLLYANRILCISSLDDRVVFDELLPLKAHEQVIGVAIDTRQKTYWIYTDSSIFELVIRDEDRDVWKVHLQRGSHESALKYVKTSVQRDAVLSAQGDRFFTEGRFIQAAQCYAQSFTRTFEEIVLRLLDADAQDALRYYLVARLERLKKTDTIQRAMLATWLTEIYLGKLDQLEDMAAARAASEDVENYRLEQGLIEEELKQFMVTYQDNLDTKTTFSLIGRHGRDSIMLHFASVVGDYDRIVRYWLQQEQWALAIEVCHSDPALFYKFSTTLMSNAPAMTVDAWLRRPELRPRHLIPAMLRHKPPKGVRNESVRYLQDVIETVTDSVVHNFLLSLLVEGHSGTTPLDAEGELLRFVLGGSAEGGAPLFDLDYALRICAENNRHEASVRLLCKRGFLDEAVELALQHKDVDLACFCADLVGETSEHVSNQVGTSQDEDSQRRKLWLRIAKHVVESKKDIKAAMEFLAANSSASILSIEDILPFFPDFTVIDAFKDDICLALESYASRIEDLKDDMESATTSADHIRQDIARLSERFVTVEPDEQCGLCGAEVMSRQFYVFPCRHSLHADCLISQTTRRLPPRTLRRLFDLQSELSKVTSGLIPALPTSLLTAVHSSSHEPSGKKGANATNATSESLTRRAGATAAAAVSGVGLDRLPEAIINVLSAGVSVSVAGGKRVLAPLDPFSEPVINYAVRGSDNRPDLEESAQARSNGHDGVEGELQATESRTRRAREEAEQVAQLRDEMDSILAATCPLCEGSLADLGKSFMAPDGIPDARGGGMEAPWSSTKKGREQSAAAHALQRMRIEEEEWAL